MKDIPTSGEFRFWCDEKLRLADTDRQGHINNAAIATRFEAGRVEIIEDTQFSAIRKGYATVLARVLINYRQEFHFPGRVRIGANISKVGRSSFEIAQSMFAGNGLVATAESTIVLIDGATRRPTPLPDEIRAFLAAS
jgi:acyl-CoA thioester hydrolase